MNFINPGFLFALFSASIPIIIHLFYFRRFRTIYFSDIRFLKSVKQDKRSKNNLKHLIILTLRILTISALVFAFARPFIPVNDQKSLDNLNKISIYIDNSRSMESQGDEEKLFETAKRLGKEIIESYSANNEFQVLTNDLEIKQQQYYNKEQAIALIDEIEPSNKAANINQVVGWQKKNLTDNEKNNFYLLSDFQKTSFDPNNFYPDTIDNYFLLPIQSVENFNIFIDSVWLESPVINFGENITLVAKIVNLSDKEIVNGTIKLINNGRQKAIATFNVGEYNSTECQISFNVSEKGWNKCEVIIEDFPVTFDDIYYLSFNVRERLNILSIEKDKTNQYLDKSFRVEEYFNFTGNRYDKIDQGQLSEFDVIIINGVDELTSSLISNLYSFVHDGGNLIIVPSINNEFEKQNELLERFGTNRFIESKEGKFEIENLNTTNFILDGILETNQNDKNLRSVQSGKMVIRGNKNSGEISLLMWNNNQSLLSYKSYEKGNVFIFNLPLEEEWSNYVKEWLFAPVLYKITLFSERNDILSYLIGENVTYELKQNLNNPDEAISMRYDSISFIPQQRNSKGRTIIYLGGNFNDPGFYEAESSENEVISMNLSRNESQMEYLNKEILSNLEKSGQIKIINAKPGQVKKEIEKLRNGIELWKFFVLMALFFIFIEILLLRLWKV